MAMPARTFPDTQGDSRPRAGAEVMVEFQSFEFRSFEFRFSSIEFMEYHDIELERILMDRMLCGLILSTTGKRQNLRNPETPKLETLETLTHEAAIHQITSPRPFRDAGFHRPFDGCLL